jgi:hypothetical protein
MNKHFLTIGLVAVTLSAAACTSQPNTLPPGEYSKTREMTNSQGTQTKVKTDTSVYYDQYGNKRAVQEQEVTKDPKGLMNKSTTKTTKTY